MRLKSEQIFSLWISFVLSLHPNLRWPNQALGLWSLTNCRPPRFSSLCVFVCELFGSEPTHAWVYIWKYFNSMEYLPVCVCVMLCAWSFSPYCSSIDKREALICLPLQMCQKKSQVDESFIPIISLCSWCYDKCVLDN